MGFGYGDDLACTYNNYWNGYLVLMVTFFFFFLFSFYLYTNVSFCTVKKVGAMSSDFHLVFYKNICLFATNNLRNSIKMRSKKSIIYLRFLLGTVNVKLSSCYRLVKSCMRPVWIDYNNFCLIFTPFKSFISSSNFWFNNNNSLFLVKKLIIRR